MKRTLFLFAALAAMAAAGAAASFEGVAEFKITMNQGKGQSTDGSAKMYLTKNAYRSEMQIGIGAAGAKGATPQSIRMTMFAKLSNPETIYMINDESKTYSIWDAKETRTDAPTRDTYTVKRLGTDTVAGLACQKALVTSSKGTEFEVCVTKELGASADWIQAMNRADQSGGSWLKALQDAGVVGFPIRWVTRSAASAAPTMVMELTRLDRKSLPASLFEVPAGYRKTDTAVGGLTPEQEKAMSDARSQMNEALKNMTPEQRKAYEDAMKRYGQPTPNP